MYDDFVDDTGNDNDNDDGNGGENPPDTVSSFSVIVSVALDS
jgi:hypothetical protein